jgi:hypothetical protein
MAFPFCDCDTVRRGWDDKEEGGFPLGDWDTVPLSWDDKGAWRFHFCDCDTVRRGWDDKGEGAAVTRIRPRGYECPMIKLS